MKEKSKKMIYKNHSFVENNILPLTYKKLPDEPRKRKKSCKIVQPQSMNAYSDKNLMIKEGEQNVNCKLPKINKGGRWRPRHAKWMEIDESKV